MLATWLVAHALACAGVQAPGAAQCVFDPPGARGRLESFLRDRLLQQGRELDAWSLATSDREARLRVVTGQRSAVGVLVLGADCGAAPALVVVGTGTGDVDWRAVFSGAPVDRRELRPSLGSAPPVATGFGERWASRLEQVRLRLFGAPHPLAWGAPLPAACLFLVGLFDLLSRRAARRFLDPPRAARVERWVGWTTGPAFVAAVSWVFFAHALPTWSPGFEYVPDYDNYLSDAWRLARDGQFPTLGPWVDPTPLRLGPLFPCLLGFALRVAGPDLLSAWRVLVSVNLLSILLAGLAAKRLVGRGRAALLVVLLATSPAIFAEQRHFFWHHPFVVPFSLMALCGAWFFLVRRRPVYWLVAVLGAGLAVQMHLTAAALAIPLAVVAVAGRREFGWRLWLQTALVLVGVNAYLFAETDVLFGAANWEAASRGLRGLVARGESSVEILGAWASLGSAVACGVLVVPAGIGVACYACAGRGRARLAPPIQVASLLVLAAVPAFLALPVVLANWWAHHYLYWGVPWMVLASWLLLVRLGAGLARLGPRFPGPVLALVALPALALWPVPADALRPQLAGAAALDAGLLSEVADVGSANGWTAQLAGPCAPRIHGVPALLVASPRNGGFFELRMEPPGACAPRDGPDGDVTDVTFAFDAFGRFTLERYETCLDRRAGDAPGGHLRTFWTGVLPRCAGRDDRKRFLVAVVAADPRAGECDAGEAGVTVDLDGEAVALDLDVDPRSESDGFGLLRTAVPVDLGRVGRVQVGLPCGVALIDLFESEAPFSGPDAGL